MTVLLDLLDAGNPPSVQSQALLVLVSALLAAPENTRAFEQLGGLQTVASLFKSRHTSREVKMKVVEFLYFYLMPEGPSSAVVMHKNPSKVGDRNGHADAKALQVEAKDGKRSTREKQQMLGRYLSNVADLVQDLRENAPFAIAVQ